MSISKMKKAVVPLALMMASSGVQAAMVSLVPADSSVMLGEQIVLDVNMDFSDDPTLGGSIDIFFDDSLVVFNSFTLDPALGSDPDFSRDPDEMPGKLEGLAFGNFAGLSGPARVGTLVFDTIDTGWAEFSLDTTTDPLKGGGFVSATRFVGQMPEYAGVLVEITTVPVPGAVWLFGSGLLGLVGVARKRDRCRRLAAGMP